jgi:hypothetical protein
MSHMKNSEESPIEWVEQYIGRGDGCTTTFDAVMSHRPIEFGTLKLFLIHGTALDLMLGLEGRKPIDPRVVVNEVTGALTVHFYSTASTAISGSFFHSPPAPGMMLWARYAWRPPRLRDARIRIKLDGKKIWVSVRELQDAFNRSDRPWPDLPGGLRRGPCRH